MHTPETTTAKLRNQLGPLYSLADTVLLLKDNPQLMDILLRQAEQCVINKEAIHPLLLQIEAEKDAVELKLKNEILNSESLTRYWLRDKERLKQCKCNTK